jgi:ribose 5-phosphate isomerase B
MIIAIGSDHAGFEMKGELAEWLQEIGHQSLNCGTDGPESVDYTDFAAAVGAAVNEGRAELGILICGTGQGSAMTANKIRGIRAALCNDSYSARLTREHNNANVLVMGARVVGSGVARDCVEAFLKTPFSNGERHQRRIEKMMLIEQSSPT